MKRVISIMLTLLLCAALFCPVMAAEDDFVPSITYKPMPELTGEQADDGCIIIGYVESDGEVIGTVHYDDGVIYIDRGTIHETVDEGHKCLVITPIAEAETDPEIPEEARELLLWVYDELLKNGMSFIDCPELDASIAAHLGEGKTVQDMVVRDLFDVSVLCEPLRAYLEPEGTTICLDFDLGLAPGSYVEVIAYKNGKWQMIEEVEVNAKGSLTCTVYEDFCPVAILVPEGTADAAEAPDTGLSARNDVVLWSAVAAASVALLVALAVIERKRAKG
ncbi:MAG: hypothetical protein IJO88_01625 [Oscillospiraceae bacterium]|nr:hypothetical protein [Oscillospiraceae bacterium]